MVWLEPGRPEEAVAFFAEEYPAMTNVAGIRALISRHGYDMIADFTIPDAAWWDDYYGPLEAKLPALKQKYAADPAALAIVEATQAEIDIRRRFGRCYGYQFFVTRKTA
jgi:hypothetical protein